MKKELSVTIEYKTSREYCHCCEQKLPKPKPSELKEFTFTKASLFEWSGDWSEIVEYEEDLHECVRDFIYETISFFACSLGDKIIIKPTEFKKVKEFVLSVVKD